MVDVFYKDVGYDPIEANWFTAKPYGFRFTPRNGEAKVMYLPIGPNNLNIVTQFATNLIPTIGGTVEEHSPVRYFDINIEGTTGMVPSYVNPITAGAEVSPNPGRSQFTVQQSLSAATKVGFFSKTLSAVDKIQAAGDNVGRSAITGVSLDQTGYLAFHNLYRFLLQYKRDAAGVSDNTTRKENSPPLVFFNHKDGNEYSVVVKSFLLRRDKEHPMLYFYSISMRGYDLTTVNDTGKNKLVKTEDLLAKLGLDGVNGSTFLSKAKNIASSARDILGSVATGVNQLGR